MREAIAVSKVKAVEESIEMSFRLKQEVGSYALMSGNGFEQMDFLLSQGTFCSAPFYFAHYGENKPVEQIRHIYCNE